MCIDSQLLALIKIATGTVDLLTPQFNEKISTQATISNSLYPKPHFNKAFLVERDRGTRKSKSLDNWWVVNVTGLISSYTVIANDLSGITTIASLRKKMAIFIYYTMIHPTMPCHLFLGFII